MSAQGIRIEDEQIKVVKNWPEPTSVRDIQVFIGFANFYQYFIRGFSRIAAPFTLMLKTTRSSGLAPRGVEDEIVWDYGNVDETIRNLSKSRKSKNNKSENLTRVPTIGATRKLIFPTPTLRKPSIV